MTIIISHSPTENYEWKTMLISDNSCFYPDLIKFVSILSLLFNRNLLDMLSISWLYDVLLSLLCRECRSLRQNLSCLARSPENFANLLMSDVCRCLCFDKGSMRYLWVFLSRWNGCLIATIQVVYSFMHSGEKRFQTCGKFVVYECFRINASWKSLIWSNMCRNFSFSCRIVILKWYEQHQ